MVWDQNIIIIGINLMMLAIQYVFQNFYQCVIHHSLTTDGNNIGINDNNRIILANRADIFNYITQFQNPAGRNQFNLNSRSRGNLGTTNPNVNPTTGIYAGNLYTKINQNEYRNFKDFTDNSLDSSRRAAKKIYRMFEHEISQIKGTLNNPDSSRSIVVYEFQICTNPTAAPNDRIYVPFLIYDLPGKEDIYKTYVDTDLTGDPKIDARLFKNMSNDNFKTEKSTYVSNPLLIPAIGDNYKHVFKAVEDAFGKVTHPKEAEICKEIHDYQVNTFGYSGANLVYQSNNSYKMDRFFHKSPSDVSINNKIAGLLNDQNINDNIGSLDQFLSKTGLLGIVKGTAPSDAKAAIKKNIAVVVIGVLIKYGLIDIVVEIICRCTGGETNPDNGGWTRNKIYSFFEAIFINENVVGLLDYLIKDILNETSNIKLQDDHDKKMNDYIDKNYSSLSRYTFISNSNITHGNTTLPVKIDMGLTIDKDLLVPIPPNEPGAFMKNLAIDKYKQDNAVNDEYVVKFNEYNNTNVSKIYEKIRRAISFENRGKYDDNKIFRNSTKECNNTKAGSLIINPKNQITPSQVFF